jgi:tRNA (uracil-5-)-methyltransferase TRM9
MPPDPDAAPTVRSAYDRIAEQFAETRQYPWPEVDTFLAEAPAGDLGLAVGCGNGRHVAPLSDRVDRVVGVDVSRGLLDVAAERCRDRPLALLQGEAAALPVADGAVDVGLYVATVHHLRPREARVRSLDELARVLAPGGRALVSAWSTEHERFDAVPASEGSPDGQRESGGGFDTTVDWTLPDGEAVPRFYHVYDPDEFREDLDRSDLRVAAAFVSSGNCYAEVKG